MSSRRRLQEDTSRRRRSRLRSKRSLKSYAHISNQQLLRRVVKLLVEYYLRTGEHFEYSHFSYVLFVPGYQIREPNEIFNADLVRHYPELFRNLAVLANRGLRLNNIPNIVSEVLEIQSNNPSMDDVRFLEEIIKRQRNETDYLKELIRRFTIRNQTRGGFRSAALTGIAAQRLSSSRPIDQDLLWKYDQAVVKLGLFQNEYRQMVKKITSMSSIFSAIERRGGPDVSRMTRDMAF